MGAKRLKAIAVRGTTKVASADPPAVLAAARDLRARSFGPATAKYRELGTLANLLAFNAISTLPTRNFQAATFAGAPQLAAEDLAQLRGVARNSCASCTIGCEHIYSVRGKKVRVEYENVFALGPMCEVYDPDAVLAASGRCDELGLDTISAAFAPHVKGLELPGYEPRTMQAMALGLAVNSRGADHNRSGAYEADLSGDHDRLAGGAAHVAAAIETEDRAAVMDSLILCKFLRGVFSEPFDEWAALLSAVTGWQVDGAELRQTARRIVMAKRAFNVREGWQPEDDWLPERLLSEPLQVGSGRVAELTPERLRGMISGYYAARGLAADGRPDQAALADLQL
jgi:aldehyde:ferredoxin oxidoreductase